MLLAQGTGSVVCRHKNVKTLLENYMGFSLVILANLWGAIKLHIKHIPVYVFPFYLLEWEVCNWKYQCSSVFSLFLAAVVAAQVFQLAAESSQADLNTFGAIQWLLYFAYLPTYHLSDFESKERKCIHEKQSHKNNQPSWLNGNDDFVSSVSVLKSVHI